MANVLKDPSHVANRPKYGHDLSKVRKFSSSVGQLLPVYYDLSEPGDKYRLNTEMFTQLTQIVSPAMMHVEEHVDWFFVPIKHISQFAHETLFGIQDRKTTFLPVSTMIDNVLPLFDIADLAYQTVQTSSTPLNYSQAKVNGHHHKFGTSMFDIPTLFNQQRLFELLGYSRNVFFNSDSTRPSSARFVNPLLLCAYQKIFYDCYRISDRTPNNPYAYNLDDLTSAGEFSPTPDAHDDYRWERMTELHYRPWERDYFTSCHVKPLVDYNDVGMLPSRGDSLAKFNNWLGSGAGLSNLNDTTVVSSQTSAASLRGMFAVEKLMEITRRAAKHYNSQVLAHYGYKVPEGIADEVYRVGSEKSVIQVNEVVATSAGDNGDTSHGTTMLGERGGKAAGYSPAGKNIEFTAPCHGVLMAVYSAVPSADYRCDGLDRINTYRTRYDFYQPELDKLGQQPLFNTEFLFNHLVPSNYILGWNWRFMERKARFNDICGIFNTTYRSWTISRQASSYYNNTDTQLSEEFFYVSPNSLNEVMLKHFNNADADLITYNQCFDRDPLLHWFKFNVFKSSVISNYSLPNL